MVERSACGDGLADEDMLCSSAAAGSPPECPSQERSPRLRLRLSLSPDTSQLEGRSQVAVAQDAATTSCPPFGQVGPLPLGCTLQGTCPLHLLIWGPAHAGAWCGNDMHGLQQMRSSSLPTHVA